MLDGYQKQYERVGAEYEISPEMITLLNHMAKSTNNNFENMTKSVAFASKKEFTDAMDELYKQVVRGQKDYASAMKETVSNLAEKGITLKSKGKNYSLESIARLNLMTSLTQTANSIAKNIGEIIDYNCVEIGHSYKCRPSHHPIDAVVMSKEEFKKYEYLTEEYNCYHIVNYSWKEEFENPNKKAEYGEEHQSLEEATKNYKIQQKARYLERQIRNKKNAISRGDISKETKKSLRNAQAKYRVYCNSNGLRMDNIRTWKYGYNKQTQIIYKWFNNLSDNEKASVNSYLKSNSYKINEALYTKRKLTLEEERLKNSLDSALEKAPKYKGIVKRSVEIRNREQFENIMSIFNNQAKIGSWGSYISSSKGVYDENMNLQFIIKSLNGRDLSSLNSEGGGEVLFERKTKFKYIDFYKENGKIYVNLEEVE